MSKDPEINPILLAVIMMAAVVIGLSLGWWVGGFFV